MKTPPYRVDYTQSAIDIYEHAKWKCYKFRKARNLNSWLSYGWSMLFKRPVTDFDIKNLTSFIEKRRNIELKQKHNLNLSINERNALKNTYIGQDGYVYMYKLMPFPEPKNPKETARLENLIAEMKTQREKEEREELSHMATKAYIKNYYRLEGTKLIKK